MSAICKIKHEACRQDANETWGEAEYFTGIEAALSALCNDLTVHFHKACPF